MSKVLSICIAIALLAGVAVESATARNRLFNGGASGYAASFGYNMHEYRDRWDVEGSLSWAGRLCGSLTYTGGEGYFGETLAGAIELAVIRAPVFGLEVGYQRIWRNRDREDSIWVPLRVFFRIGLGGGFHLIPHGALAAYVGEPAPNLKGDVGLDLTWRALRLAGEMNVNEDFRYHDITLRAGLIGTF